jgi:hypothetical protein
MTSNDSDTLIGAPRSLAWTRRLTEELAVLATMVVAALTLASGASAADDNQDPDPPPSTAKPNLVPSASVVAYGASEREVRCTVRNVGTTTAAAFR